MVEKIEESESPIIFSGNHNLARSDNPEVVADAALGLLFRHDVPYKSFPRNHKKLHSHKWVHFFMLPRKQIAIIQHMVMSTTSGARWGCCERILWMKERAKNRAVVEKNRRKRKPDNGDLNGFCIVQGFNRSRNKKIIIFQKPIDNFQKKSILIRFNGAQLNGRLGEGIGEKDYVRIR